MHLATFFIITPIYWVVLPVALVLVSGMLGRIAGVASSPQLTFRAEGIVTVGIFMYAVSMFVYVYRSTDEATSVAQQNGEYISLHKDRILRSITDREYLIFPNLWARALTAWFVLLAWLGVTGP